MFVIRHHSLPHPRAPAAQFRKTRQTDQEREHTLHLSGGRWTRRTRPRILGSVTLSPTTAEPVRPALKGPEWEAGSSTGCEPRGKPWAFRAQSPSRPNKEGAGQGGLRVPPSLHVPWHSMGVTSWDTVRVPTAACSYCFPHISA